MKKIKKINIKTNIETINKILKQNEPIIDFISKIVLTLVTISIAVIANSISKKQIEIEEINILSNIEINYIRDEEYMETNRIEIYNNGGPIYNVNIDVYSFLHIYNFENQLDTKIPINIYIKSYIGKPVGLIAFCDEFVCNHITNVEEIVNNDLVENGFEFDIGLTAISYIKISYEDKFKNSTISYFIDKANVSTDLGKKIEHEYYEQEVMDIK